MAAGQFPVWQARVLILRRQGVAQVKAQLKKEYHYQHCATRCEGITGARSTRAGLAFRALTPSRRLPAGSSFLLILPQVFVAKKASGRENW
jgi:hypothetical protein